MSKKLDKPSKGWYVVPILFGLIGGIIAYYALKNRDKKMAKNSLYIGLGITGAYVFSVGLVAYLQSGFKYQIHASCDGKEHSIRIDNIGTSTISKDDLIIYVDGERVSCDKWNVGGGVIISREYKGALDRESAKLGFPPQNVYSTSGSCNIFTHTQLGQHEIKVIGPKKTEIVYDTC